MPWARACSCRPLPGSGPGSPPEKPSAAVRRWATSESSRDLVRAPRSRLPAGVPLAGPSSRSVSSPSTPDPGRRRRSLQGPQLRRRRLDLLERVAQRLAEVRALDLEHVPRLAAHSGSEAERRSPEEVQVHAAGPAEHRILEVVVLETADAVGHVALTALELPLPEHLPSAQDARLPDDPLGQSAEQQLGPHG